MSRSLGLREDQREGEVLATLIAVLFPVDPVGCNRGQARSHKDLCRCTNRVNNTKPLWERACPR